MSAVLVEKRDKVGIITINRPEVSNTLNREVVRKLREILVDFDGDKGIWVIILTGAGERGFCSGLDLKERKTMTEEEIEYSRRFEFVPFLLHIEEIGTPMIAAVNGVAIGGGAELALACDIRVASENASFGLREVQWGIIPAGGAIQRLPLLSGMGVAKELILSGKLIDAKKAEEFRIYNHVVPASQLMEKTLAVAEELVQNSPVALRQAKKALNFRAAIYYGISYDVEASNVCYHSEDRKEGVLAFSEKRKPKWKNI